jgi:hypothetical protein
MPLQLSRWLKAGFAGDEDSGAVERVQRGVCRNAWIKLTPIVTIFRGGEQERAFEARGDHGAGPLRSKSCFSGFEVSRA